MLIKDLKKEITTLTLPELRDIIWQIRADLENSYKGAIEDFSKASCSTTDPRAEELRHSSLKRMAEIELYAGDMFGCFRNDLRKLAEELPYFSHDDAVEMGKVHWSIRMKERQNGD